MAATHLMSGWFVLNCSIIYCASFSLELQKSGCQTFDGKSLAETFKSQGNKAMQSKLYSDAIELYTFAIALCEDNAVYYCNRILTLLGATSNYLILFCGFVVSSIYLPRAAAYTQISQYAEAIRDCLKSIEINPSYSKAYSRLGFAYYAQGNYRDAINKGFMKALQLDPNNDSVKENIRVAEQKLIEEQRRAEHHEGGGSCEWGKGVKALGKALKGGRRGWWGGGSCEWGRGKGGVEAAVAMVARVGKVSKVWDANDISETIGEVTSFVRNLGEGSRSASHQDSNQQSAGGSRSHSMPPPLTSMPFNANGLPADIASMFMNMASNMRQGQHSQASTEEADSSTDTFDEPEIRIGGNINLNFGDQMPEDITGALRSVMEMFSGASPSANQPEDMNGRSAPS
ncbi:tetratricopeptide repeat (TPR)-like superfamily protein [Actinidia rufa]|uniref:Tetratricopeptide repeat (TPR)-like superfamily protein n=1 Tax=Actinidia rufa TaxID=165716 RepID=A0A7J0DRM5_9ERIC|nr:tetratricopeptide repeat (TPR)-like superfamily protein [Actinidia rufa]